MKKNKTPMKEEVRDYLIILALFLIDFLLIIFALALMGVGR